MFKLGDKVKVRNNVVVEKEYNDGCLFTSSMEFAKGATHIITKTWLYGDENRYHLSGGRGFAFTDDMLELKRDIDFKKLDEGVEMTNCDTTIRFETLNSNEQSHVHSIISNDEILYITQKEEGESRNGISLKEDEVEQLHKFLEDFLYYTKTKKEENTKVMTLEEIEEKLGYKIKLK